jgi:putative transposase
MGGPRGRKIKMSDRQKITSLIDEAHTSGATLGASCKVLGISSRTYQRWNKNGDVNTDRRKEAAGNRQPANKLSDQERQKIIEISNQPKFSEMSPNQIIPELADQGVFIASESTFYRVLKENDQLAHRGKSKLPVNKRPKPLYATAPNMLWSWDITYLHTTVKGLFFYLYLIMDVYSRKIVGWEVYESESAEQASIVIKKAYLREGIAGKILTLHSDNGAPMKGATMLGTLQKLGVMPSFSRPSVSNDNPYSESLFKTLKYHPGMPEKPFASVEEARTWVAQFKNWYNEVHHHSTIKFVTPSQRHQGEDIAILSQRKDLYESVKSEKPERWAGNTRNWDHEKIVYLNPNNSNVKGEDLMKKVG